MDGYSFQSKCHEYLQRGEQLWDSYFSKWEELAGNEAELDENDLIVDEYENLKPRSLKPKLKKKVKGKISIALKLRNKSVSTLNNKNVINERIKRNNKKLRRGGEEDEKRKKIVRKQKKEPVAIKRNQTNLESEEEENNEHVEADLRTVFVEIQTASANKSGIFSILSKTLSCNGTMMNDFSFSSFHLNKLESSSSNRLINRFNSYGNSCFDSRNQLINGLGENQLQFNLIHSPLIDLLPLPDPDLGNDRFSGFWNRNECPRMMNQTRSITGVDYLPNECGSRTCYQFGVQNSNFPAFWNRNECTEISNQSKSIIDNDYLHNGSFSQRTFHQFGARNSNAPAFWNRNQCLEPENKTRSFEPSDYLLKKRFAVQSNSGTSRFPHFSKMEEIEENRCVKRFKTEPENRFKYPALERVPKTFQITKSCSFDSGFSSEISRLNNDREDETEPETTASNDQKLLGNTFKKTPNNKKPLRNCFSENKPSRNKRKRSKFMLIESDDEDDNDQDELNFPRTSLKIFCTPKRPLLVDKKKEFNNSDSDDESIFDRLKR